MQFDRRRKEYADKDSLQLVARDKLITAKMVSEDRVENLRYGDTVVYINFVANTLA